ncbi:MAG: hypothetical protein MI867_06995 [Pseudomonadales bacterium]|nr:hypothetical protein [Pseudomonadales bacterium]
MDTNQKLSKITAIVIMVAGFSMYVSYLVYLPIPAVFENLGTASIGLILYSLASAGAGFMAWGLMLSKTNEMGIGRQQVLQATGIGLVLLGVMRLGTAIFPHDPFGELIYVPISECIVFTLLGIKFYKSQ